MRQVFPFHRVEEYINTGHDKNVIDPDPDKIYLKRKERQSGQLHENKTTDCPVTFPDDCQWSTKLERMPMFSKAEMNIHVSKTGKKLDPKKHGHSVPTSLRKAKSFLNDEYLQDIKTASDSNFFFVKSLCHHSYRKNDPPHILRLALCLVTAEVKYAHCSCAAGKVGFCNHVLSLMMQLCKYTLYECKDTRDLNEEEDMCPKVACTSSLQLWHKVGRGDNIQPKPVMDLVIKKTKVNDSTTSCTHKKPDGLRCLIYEARNNIHTQKADEHKLKEDLLKINPEMALAQIMAPADQTEFVETKFGKSAKGLFASYQLSFTESNFNVYCDIESMQRCLLGSRSDLQYSKFPLQHTDKYGIPAEQLSSPAKILLEHLSVDVQKLNNIEESTRAQGASEAWRNKRKYRLTASNFHLICCRQRNMDTLVDKLLYPTAIHSRYTNHGQTYEPIALREYEKYMFSTRRPIKLLKSSFVVCMDAPFLGASPDGKVVDKGCTKPFGLVEVKCPETKFRVTPLDACSDGAFYCENVEGKPKLKKKHQYYYQVPGQMGATKADWCDFVIYTLVGMSIERIKFDDQFWNATRCKLEEFYFSHFLKRAAVEYCSRKEE